MNVINKKRLGHELTLLVNAILITIFIIFPTMYNYTLSIQSNLNTKYVHIHKLCMYNNIYNIYHHQYAVPTVSTALCTD